MSSAKKFRRNRKILDYSIIEWEGLTEDSILFPSEHDLLMKAKQYEIEDKILNKREEGLSIVETENKGRGVIANKTFCLGDFVVEYAGDLIDLKTAYQREIQYCNDPVVGCYMFYFSHSGVRYCIDATAENGRVGRLVNHSRTNYNCKMKVTEIEGRPYLILTASRNIFNGEEILYDYGDRSKESLLFHSWLKS
ncbi:SETD8 [Mytilus coruscus]|uniref:SETD8 n=1 Tax=Mytilus coruscus TaxID=42192 RepID=A0A6J8BN45_MYTCO|nr:SETD8 [Mytilus coruscus]